VEANKKVSKRVQIVLTQRVETLGEPGALVAARTGYFRNYLLPQGLAKLADEGVLAGIKAKQLAEEAAARKLLDEAKALATALQTIGKFVVKVKVGEKEKGESRIFGSVDANDVLASINQQCGAVGLTKSMFTLPDIKLTGALSFRRHAAMFPDSWAGTYGVTAKLHPQVTATFQLMVTKL